MRTRLTKPGRREAQRRTHAPRPPAKPEREPTSAAATGGVEDRELYSCACGIVFQGLVSASARCPKCGAEQAW